MEFIKETPKPELGKQAKQFVYKHRVTVIKNGKKTKQWLEIPVIAISREKGDEKARKELTTLYKKIKEGQPVPSL
jgi:primosomal replication protein N